MRRSAKRKKTCRAFAAAVSLCVTFGTVSPAGLCAEEQADIFSNELYFSEEGSEIVLTPGTESEQSVLTGSYSVGEDWVRISDLSTEEEAVYKKSGKETEEETSAIRCWYMDTNYTVLEYEQLRDMLTNNLVYGNVNAQVSASAGYTDVKDYLYILTSDDSAEDYRDIFYYVVGDRRCFCVEVREYRAEAEQMKAEEKEQPSETGMKTAQKFVWNTAG